MGSGDSTINYANLVIAVVVPFLSVYVAQWLSRQHARRQDAKDAFLRINKDVHDFRLAFLERHPTRIPKKLVMGPPIMEVPDGTELDRRSRTMLDCVAAINGDYLMLGLIFDKEADRLGSRLKSLGGKADLVVNHNPLDHANPPPTYSACQTHLNTDIEAIFAEMKPLWDSLSSWKWLPFQICRKARNRKSRSSNQGG